MVVGGDSLGKGAWELICWGGRKEGNLRREGGERLKKAAVQSPGTTLGMQDRYQKNFK